MWTEECIKKTRRNIEKNDTGSEGDEDYEGPPFAKIKDASSDIHTYALRCRDDIQQAYDRLTGNGARFVLEDGMFRF